MRLMEVLLVEDNDGEIVLMLEAFAESKIRNAVQVVRSLDNALDYLFKRSGFEQAIAPDFILVNTSLQKENTTATVEVVKAGSSGKIPVIIITPFPIDPSLRDACDGHAFRYITKPSNTEDYVLMIHEIEELWSQVVNVSSAA